MAQITRFSSQQSDALGHQRALKGRHVDFIHTADAVIRGVKRASNAQCAVESTHLIRIITYGGGDELGVVGTGRHGDLLAGSGHIGLGDGERLDLRELGGNHRGFGDSE